MQASSTGRSCCCSGNPGLLTWGDNGDDGGVGGDDDGGVGGDDDGGVGGDDDGSVGGDDDGGVGGDDDGGDPCLLTWGDPSRGLRSD